MISMTSDQKRHRAPNASNSPITSPDLKYPPQSKMIIHLQKVERFFSSVFSIPILQVFSHDQERELYMRHSSVAGSRYPERDRHLYAQLQVAVHALPMAVHWRISHQVYAQEGKQGPHHRYSRPNHPQHRSPERFGSVVRTWYISTPRNGFLRVFFFDFLWMFLEFSLNFE